MADFSVYIKKTLLSVLSPVALIFLFLLIVTLYVVLGKRRGRHRFLFFVAVFLYFISTTPFMPYFLLNNLEKGFKIPQEEEIAKARYLVVLTGRIYSSPQLNLEERFSRETIIRFLVALEVKRRFPEKKLIIVGGSLEGKGSSYLSELAKRFNIDSLPLDTPLDTFSSAKALKDSIPQGESFVLFTSAYHLPRTLLIFKKEGLNPIPYPTNFNHLLCKPANLLFYILPQDLYLNLTSLAVQEYLGIAYYKIKYWFKRK